MKCLRYSPLWSTIKPAFLEGSLTRPTTRRLTGWRANSNANFSLAGETKGQQAAGEPGERGDQPESLWGGKADEQGCLGQKRVGVSVAKPPSSGVLHGPQLFCTEPNGPGAGRREEVGEGRRAGVGNRFSPSVSLRKCLKDDGKRSVCSQMPPPPSMNLYIASSFFSQPAHAASGQGYGQGTEDFVKNLFTHPATRQHADVSGENPTSAEKLGRVAPICESSPPH